MMFSRGNPPSRLIFGLMASTLVVLFAVSSALTLLQNNSVRGIFFFEGRDGGTYTEIRRLAQNQHDDLVERYVSELLLGAENAHFKSLFNPATRARACFVRGKVVYLDLSEDALFPSQNTRSIRGGA
jgi:hypothetical protein